MCFPLVCESLLLHCLGNLRDIELYRDTELRKEEVESEERKEFFSLLEQREKPYPLENKCKQAEQRQMGMVRKSGKDKETFAEWK